MQKIVSELNLPILFYFRQREHKKWPFNLSHDFSVEIVHNYQKEFIYLFCSFVFFTFIVNIHFELWTLWKKDLETMWPVFCICLWYFWNKFSRLIKKICYLSLYWAIYTFFKKNQVLLKLSFFNIDSQNGESFYFRILRFLFLNGQIHHRGKKEMEKEKEEPE